MPDQNVGACNASCAAKLAKLIVDDFADFSPSATSFSLLKQTAPAPEDDATASENSLVSSNQTSCGIAYSQIDLRPLTKQEYSTAIAQLTGINLLSDLGLNIDNLLPPDNLTSAYYNNETITLDGDTKRAYQSLANTITEQLYAQNFSGIVDCSNNKEECYNKLIDGFACKAFRRPLNSEERIAYQSLFTGNSKDGIKNVVNALLSSPQFIYRSNVGLTTAHPEDIAAFANAVSLSYIDKTIRIYEKENLNATLTGNDILEVAVKATQSPTGLWPVMRIQLGQSTFVDLVVKHSDSQVYRFHVAGLKGSTSLTIINQQTGAALEYQTGHNLVVSSVKLLSSD